MGPRHAVSKLVRRGHRPISGVLHARGAAVCRHVGARSAGSPPPSVGFGNDPATRRPTGPPDPARDAPGTYLSVTAHASLRGLAWGRRTSPATAPEREW